MLNDVNTISLATSQIYYICISYMNHLLVYDALNMYIVIYVYTYMSCIYIYICHVSIYLY